MLEERHEPSVVLVGQWPVCQTLVPWQRPRHHAGVRHGVVPELAVQGRVVLDDANRVVDSLQHLAARIGHQPELAAWRGLALVVAKGGAHLAAHLLVAHGRLAARTVGVADDGHDLLVGQALRLQAACVPEQRLVALSLRNLVGQLEPLPLLCATRADERENHVGRLGYLAVFPWLHVPLVAVAVGMDGGRENDIAAVPPHVHAWYHVGGRLHAHARGSLEEVVRAAAAGDARCRLGEPPVVSHPDGQLETTVGFAVLVDVDDEDAATRRAGCHAYVHVGDSPPPLLDLADVRRGVLESARPIQRVFSMWLQREHCQTVLDVARRVIDHQHQSLLHLQTALVGTQTLQTLWTAQT